MQQPVYDRLYQFTQRGGQMSLPVHQYLLASSPSLMMATGSYEQAQWILPIVAEILEGKPLEYLFISHMESDECGGVFLFHKRYSKMVVLCSAFTANELKGYGYKGKIVIVDEGRQVSAGDLRLGFIRYPSEVHLQDGLLVIEENSGIFYSSDLMHHLIRGGQTVVDGNWADEISTIDNESNLSQDQKESMKVRLSRINPRFIAKGHGSCTRV